MTPSPSAHPIVWAVFLRADTPHRLAREWSIPLSCARDRMRYAAVRGLICKAGRRRMPSKASGQTLARAHGRNCPGRMVTFYRVAGRLA